jgi:UDP-N-acetylglucosamine 4-epimerase
VDIQKKKVLVTGGAGFIGSHLAAALLRDERVSAVRVLDNLATGHLKNIKPFLGNNRFEFIEGDIRDFSVCERACEGIHLVSHQAALGSVPRSIKDPLTSHNVNVTGTLHILQAAVRAGVSRVVFASSSSLYGDNEVLPKVEDKTGNPLSPYAATKSMNEMYAAVFARTYGLEYIGLRYFNVFGPNQDPEGPYAAVIPLFFKAARLGVPPVINGDGNHSRDFTYVDNAVQANLLGLFVDSGDTGNSAVNQIYNVACGKQTTLNAMWAMISEIMGIKLKPEYGPERPGDILHSLADIHKAERLLGYVPNIDVSEGLRRIAHMYI